MKWLLGPGQQNLRVPFYRHDLVAAAIESPGEAWSYHQDLVPHERIWVLGQSEFIALFCEPPWQGLFHLVTLVEGAISPAVCDASVALLGASIAPDRLAEFCAALQWPNAQLKNETQISSCPGAVHWIDDLPCPAELRHQNEGFPVPVVARASQRWPAAHYVDGNCAPGPMPLLYPRQWMSNRNALDALAQLRETRAQTL